MKFLLRIFFFYFLTFGSASADEASEWLKGEIDIIINAYQNTNISDESRFLLIEDTINNNFAGKALGKFVAKQAYVSATIDVREQYISLFKRHLALNITSMMQGYSSQNYQIVDSKYNDSNKTTMIDMEVKTNTDKILVTWRIKEHKDRFFVIDFYVANISLMQAKRSEFNSMLKKIEYNLEAFNKILQAQNELSYNKFIN